MVAVPHQPIYWHQCVNKRRTLTCHNKSVAKHKLHTRLFPLALQNVYFSISLTLASPAHPLLPSSAQCHVLWVSLTSCSHSVRRCTGPDTVTCAALSERGALSMRALAERSLSFRKSCQEAGMLTKCTARFIPSASFKHSRGCVLQCEAAQHWNFFAIYLMLFAYCCFIPLIFLAFCITITLKIKNLEKWLTLTFIVQMVKVGKKPRCVVCTGIVFIMCVCMKWFVCWWQLLLFSDTVSDNSVFRRNTVHWSDAGTDVGADTRKNTSDTCFCSHCFQNL